MPEKRSWFVVACCSSLLALAGCAGSSGGGGATTYHGIIAAPNESGTIVIATSSTSSTATGTVAVTGSGSFLLSGTFDSSSKALSLTGAGYSFTGALSNRTLSGTYHGPKGDGDFSALSDEGTSVSLYCGTFGGSDAGVWNLSVDASGNATGAFHSNTSSASGVLNGSVSGGNVSLTFSGGSASGTLGGGGTWTSGSSSGSWTVANHC